MKFTSTLTLLITPLALALPTVVTNEASTEAAGIEAPTEHNVLQARAGVNCGGRIYTAAEVSDAISTGMLYYRNNMQIGPSTHKYPHAFGNRERFTFAVPGPYQEFPLTHGKYTGNKPGTDRVIFDTTGKAAGTVYHHSITNVLSKCV